ncbi:flagellar biosynthesis repressor FlbT [Geotalea sp. SG265]|uniref:flagellar biosynthesis repressor FlbT n=1 Tax=Geotalea sp. SG265 TaxID=2922867 RepID=UPI001FAFAEC8|nr:flagellar biosynthesis repressor FlbT [Geotalea sp. SG265]
MALKISLKPGERMIIGGAVIRNGAKATDFYVENKVAILREKDILAEQEATTPCRRLYLVIQLMYIDDGNLSNYTGTYWELVKALVDAAPSMVPTLDRISEFLVGGNCYQALKLTQDLIDYEEELIKNAC